MAKVRGLQSLKRKVKRLQKAAAPGAEDGLLKAGEIVSKAQKRLAPVEQGELRDSIDYELTTSARTGNRAVRIFASDMAAHMVEFGTAPHPIKPKNREALQIGSNEFAESARHPGTIAQPFFFPGFRSSRRRARSAINKGIRDDVKKAAR